MTEIVIDGVKISVNEKFGEVKCLYRYHTTTFIVCDLSTVGKSGFRYNIYLGEQWIGKSELFSTQAKASDAAINRGLGFIEAHPC